MQHDHIQIYFYFYSDPQVENVCNEKVCACIMVCICFIPFYFDIQHDHVLKKLNFDFFLTPPPPPRVGEGDGALYRLFLYIIFTLTLEEYRDHTCFFMH